MNRRNFLHSGILATASSVLPTEIFANGGKTSSSSFSESNANSTIFATESGTYYEDAIFVIGFLIVSNDKITDIENQLAVFRTQSNI